MDETQFARLLNSSEGDTLDFKAEMYDLKNELNVASLIKDVTALFNTPRVEDSLLILGVKKHPNGKFDLPGLTSHPDDEQLQSQFHQDRIHPRPKFRYEPFEYQGASFGIITIPRSPMGPSIPPQNFPRDRKLLQAHELYFRQGSKNAIAKAAEIARIYEWFATLSRPVQKITPELIDQPQWEAVAGSLHDLEPGRAFILLADRPLDPPSVARLGFGPWCAVIDLDPASESGGLYAAMKPHLSSRRTIHLVSPGRPPSSFNPMGGTYWYFARGLAGGPTSPNTTNYRDWLARLNRPLQEFMERLAPAVLPLPVTVLVLLNDPAFTSHVRRCLEQLIHVFPSTLDVLIVPRDATDVSVLADELNCSISSIAMNLLGAGIESLAGQSTATVGGRIELPTAARLGLPLEDADARWFEEELELVHLGAGARATTEGEVGVDFLRGRQITWYELALRYDVERDQGDQISQRVRADLDTRKTSRVNLYHAPGAGGTTVGRSILWRLHNTFPTAILSRMSDPRETAERISKLSSLTSQSCLILIDGAQVEDRRVDALFEELLGHRTPCVILQVLRRFKPPGKGGERTFYLKTPLTPAEIERFTHVLCRAVPHRRPALQRVATEGTHASAFYFGLEAFGRDFHGLNGYVKSRLADSSPQEKHVVGLIAMAHHYAHQAVPSQVFVTLLGLAGTSTVHMERALRAELLELLVREPDGRWRTSHDLVAIEVIEQLLAGNAIDQRVWKQHLSGWAREFARLCRGNDPVPSAEMLETAKRAFLFRDNSELLGTEQSASGQFSELIQDVPSREGAYEVLLDVATLFQSEPHFWAHLGRYCGLVLKDHQKAVVFVDKALALQPDDRVLHHMRGMALRGQVYELIQAQAPLAQIIPIAKDASAAFERAREIAPWDEHAYISDIQLAIRLVEYAARNTSGGVTACLTSSAVDPFVREGIERAEGLLDLVRVQRTSQRQSNYETDCRARVSAMYGRYEDALQAWDRLLSGKQVHQPPIRRQIVWAMVARRNGAWDQLRPNEVRRIVDLLERNQHQEPHDSSNIRLWIRAIRRLETPPSLERVLELVTYWRANSPGAIEPLYYCYIVNVLLALAGSQLARQSANQQIEECKVLSRSRANRKISHEWLGPGAGMHQLVGSAQLGEMREGAFYEKRSLLRPILGRISRIDAPQAGQIELDVGLQVFFVPAIGGHARGRSENQRVQFYLGFSYEGLRGWEVKEAT